MGKVDVGYFLGELLYPSKNIQNIL
jgi:hypothetical protein